MDVSDYDLILSGGEIVGPDKVYPADVAVKGGLIAALGPHGTLGSAASIVDARGKVVFPGVIDPHLHCAIHSHHVDSLSVALAAAARGGVTTAVVHLLPAASTTMRPLQLLDEFRDFGGREGVIDFSFHAWLPEVPGILDDVPRLIDEGIQSFKLFLAYRTIGRMASDAHLLSSMEAIAAARGILLVHAEDGEILEHRIAAQRRSGRIAPRDFRWTHPDEAEWVAIYKAVQYAKITECPVYIVHVSTPHGVDIVEEARGRGQAVWAETCPQYLELTDESMLRYGPLAKISPPLRDREANEGLWTHLAEGRIDAVGSDHSPHSRETKAAGYEDIFACWYGAPGVQTMLPVMWDAFLRRDLPFTLLARLLAEQPARVFGLHNKGVIAAGKDADLVVIDPNREVELRDADQIGASGYTLYNGRKVKGWPIHSFVRGNPVLDGSALHSKPSYGRYVPRSSR